MSTLRQNSDLGFCRPRVTPLPRPVYIRLEDFATDTHAEPHTHAWGQLAYSISGLMKVETPQGHYMIPPRHALWIPKGTLHCATMPVGTQFRSLYIEDPYLARFPDHCLVYDVSPLVRELIKTFALYPPEYDENGEGGRLVLVMIDQILNLPATRLYLPMSGAPGLQALLEQLQANPGDQRTLEEWAEQLHCSSRTLARRFEQELGMGFREWRQRVRLLAALQALEDGDSITQTALGLGYDSVSAFIAMFRKSCGTTPGEYLRRFSDGRPGELIEEAC